jgi:hypothetical protein
MKEMPNDDNVRAAFESLSRDAAFTAQCPPADRLWAGARGELSPADVEDLSMHLAECGACAAAWRAARDFGGRATLAAPRVSPPIDWRLAAAAVIVLASGLTLFYINREPQLLLAPTTRAVTPSIVIAVDQVPVKVSPRYGSAWRGPGDGQRFLAALRTALQPYERGDYAAAVRTLSQLHSDYLDTPEPALYLGISMVLAGGGGEAIATLEHARGLAETEQMDDATWFLAAAYERAGRRSDAARAAQLVCDAKGPRAARACEAASALGASR